MTRKEKNIIWQIAGLYESLKNIFEGGNKR